MLPKRTRVCAKPQLQAHRHREITVRVPDSHRKPRNQGHIRAEQHALARFLAADQPPPLSNRSSSHQPKSNPLANSSAAYRPNPDPLASTSPVHRPEPTLLQTTPQTVRPKPAPYQQPFRPSDRSHPLTNTPLSHRPGVEGLHGAAPYCVCATPSPSGAPIARGLSPRCAPHRPSSIRS